MRIFCSETEVRCTGKCYEAGGSIPTGIVMRRQFGLFVATAVAIALAWWWLGRPVALPSGAADPGGIPCLSYAPFRGDQSPLVASTHVEARQIEEDLAKLARLTGCVRTYATDNGLDQVPAVAQRLGIKVLQGLWLGSDRQKNRVQIDSTLALAKRYPDVIIGLVVGNEVLLRGELAAEDIAGILREVKAATAVPVTYADVWEYWLRNRDLAQAVDFVTVHILPYWEDDPIAAERAGAHVDAIRSRVAASFPGKDILIGEVGWPSAGRMREGALPSPSNQALVLAEVVARARAQNYRVNLIEAFDQPWKRRLEGTVGGYWGLFGSSRRELKFDWGRPVSDHPWWPWQLGFGLVMAAVVFAAAMAAGNGALRRWNPGKVQAADGHVLAGIAVIALTAGVTVPWAIADVAIESLGLGGWVRGAAFAAVALAAPVAAGMALAGNIAVPAFARILGRPAGRPRNVIAWAGGLVLVAATILSIQTALGLVFDPRYRDFTYAPLSAAVVPLAVAALLGVRGSGPRGAAETIAAVTLAGSAVTIVLNEGFANWQALWFAAVLVVLAVTLARLRDAQST
jgi:exo-beta-1,3-glucanase (GH17 family)